MPSPHRQTLLAAALFFSYPAFSSDTSLETIVVSANRFATADVDATYASEVHTRKQIEQSGSATFYDYLAQHTSVQVAPNYGNRFTPKIDMRGFGLGDGYQNIVVTIDGKRMNNIDMSGQLIGSIPLVDVERIEITKGSGSVMFGDGATAGTIQIYTRPHSGVNFQAYTGSHGTLGTTATAGLNNDKVSLHATIDKQDSDGTSNADVKGKKAASRNDTARLGLSVSPFDALTLKFDAASTNIETRYPGRLTLAQLNANPAQNGGATYTLQELKSDIWSAGAEAKLTQRLKLNVTHSVEDKRSRYPVSGFTGDYNYVADDIALSYQGNAFSLVGGFQNFDGSRRGSSDRTSKENAAWFTQGQYDFGKTIVSAGVRTENVEYRYRPNTGSALQQNHDLNAWDIGINHRIDDHLTFFSNFNSAYQAPDIDRFFTNGTFNAFIQPAKSRTLNIGMNHVTAANRFKATAFHTDLKNEIYYFSTGNFLTSYNTNIDKSHKYGMEVQDTWRATSSLSLSLNYSIIKAIIDEERDGGGAFNGKELPGVPLHNINLGLNYRFNDQVSVNLSQTWRSSTWAAEDFDNNNLQKQRAYSMTDVAFRYRFKDVEMIAAVDNLFEKTNGLWIRDDRIYPVNFARTWRVGLNTKF